jgi:NADH-quinone oxidoreductase subunit N
LDVYEGSLISVTAFFAIVPKIVLSVVLLRVLLSFLLPYASFWSILLAFSGSLSVVVASIATLYQKRLKRLMAFSTVSHIGFVLLGFSTVSNHSTDSVLLYLIIYMGLSVGAFSLIMRSTSKSGLLKYLIN